MITKNQFDTWFKLHWEDKLPVDKETEKVIIPLVTQGIFGVIKDKAIQSFPFAYKADRDTTPNDIRNYIWKEIKWQSPFALVGISFCKGYDVYTIAPEANIKN